MRTLLSPGIVHVALNVGTVTVVGGIASSPKSYHDHENGALVDVSVKVTCSLANGCCCSGNPASVPVGPHVKFAVGTAVWLHTMICRCSWLEPLQLVDTRVTVYVPGAAKA